MKGKLQLLLASALLGGVHRQRVVVICTCVFGLVIVSVIRQFGISRDKWAFPQDRTCDQRRVLRGVVDSVSEGLIVASASGNILIWNRAAEELLGPPSNSIHPECWSERYSFYHSDGTTPFPAKELPLTKAVRGEASDGVLLTLRYSNEPDKQRLLQSSARPVRDEKGAIQGGVVVFRDVSEVKKTIEALRRSEDRYRLLLESTAEGIFAVDLEGNCTICNPAALRLLGFGEVNEVLGKNMHALIHHTHADGTPNAALECAIYSAYRQGKGVHVEDDVFWRADGSPISVEYTSHPLVYDGRNAGAVIAFQDITARRKSEEALRQSEERFHAAFDRAAIGMTILSPEGSFLAANQAYCQMTEYPEGELKRLTFSSITHHDDRENCLALCAQLVSGQVPSYVVEKRYVTKSGSIKWVKISVSAFRKGTEQAINVIALAEDISDRKKAEDALQQNSHQLQALFDNALDAVVIADTQARIVDANAAACRLFGLSRQNLIARSLREFAEKDGSFEKTWTQFLQQGSYEGQEMLVPPDGHRRVIDVSAAANFLPNRHLAILRDITDQKRLEMQLRQAQKMEAVGRLAGGIAHDFNNLLNIIGGFSELLQAELHDYQRGQKLLAEVIKATQRATKLTSQLLAFSRKQVLTPSVVDVNSAISDTARMLAPLIGEDIELKLALAQELGRIKVDPSQLEQVILNLAVNARDAMPKGGSLTIETINIYLDETAVDRHPSAKPGKYILVAVTDTGTGMTEEVAARIFEPFFTTKELGQGTGLGLATVYGIVKQSGGWIWVYSEIGIGTTFKIYFPSLDDAPTVSPYAVEPKSRTSGTETILLVEDEGALREATKQYLQGCGYTVIDAADGNEALELARDHDGHIALMVTDVIMPKRSGRDLARILSQSMPELSVIYVSGYTDDTIVHHGVLEPGLNFIQKPYGLHLLAEKIRQVLDSRLPG